MSRIDKLVAKAFPDELRSVTPVETDEAALFAMTLKKLGLEPAAPAAPEEPKGPLAFLHREKSQGKLIEVPLEQVKHRWASWLGGAIAACLVLSCGIYWGGWLMHSLGVGTRAHSAGEEISHPGVEAVSPSPASQEDVPQSEELSMQVVSCLPSENSLTVGVKFHGLSPSLYMAEVRCKGNELYCVARSTEGDTEEESTLKLTFVGEKSFEDAGNEQLVLRFQLIPGQVGAEEENAEAYPQQVGFVINTTSGYVKQVSGEELSEEWERLG